MRQVQRTIRWCKLINLNWNVMLSYSNYPLCYSFHGDENNDLHRPILFEDLYMLMYLVFQSPLRFMLLAYGQVRFNNTSSPRLHASILWAFHLVAVPFSFLVSLRGLTLSCLSTSQTSRVGRKFQILLLT